jgi:ankyrin repeat protein
MLQHFRPAILERWIDIASHWKNGRLLDLLLQHGGNINARYEGSNHDMLGETALHAAARGGYIDSMRLLVSRGADLNALDAHGRTPLMELATNLAELEAGRAARIRYAGKPKTEFMLKLEAESKSKPPTEDRAPPESLAALAAILELGADASRKDTLGNDALDYYWFGSIRRREPIDLAAEDLLRKAGATGDAPTRALFEAFLAKNLTQVEHAIAAGADVNRQCPWGNTPLTSAWDVDAADALLKAGADPNLPSRTTYPLADAASSGDLLRVKRLLVAGANLHALQPHTPNSEYIANAYSVALTYNKQEVADYLHSLGARQPVRENWKPLEPGVHMWENFSELLINLPVEAAADALARFLGGKAELHMYGKVAQLPKTAAYVLTQPKGMHWTNIFQLVPAPKWPPSTSATDKFAKGLARIASAPLLSIDYSDASGAAQIIRFNPDGTTTQDDGWDHDTLQETVDALGDEAPADLRKKLSKTPKDSPDSSTRLKNLAQQEKFAVAAFSFSPDAANKVDLSIAGLPAEAFENVALVTK